MRRKNILINEINKLNIVLKQKGKMVNVVNVWINSKY